MNTGTWVVAGALCAALNGGMQPARAQDAELTTAKLEWRSKVLGGTKANEVKITSGTPEGLTAPAEDGDLKFGRILGRTWVCVDYSEKARLWVDLNMDGDLTDERVISIKPTGQKWSLERTILLPVEGRALPFTLDVRLYQTATCSATHVHFVLQAHLAGLIELAGRVRHIAVTDGNADLKFDGAADKVFIDVDGDGHLTIADNSIDRIHLGQPVRIGSSTFTAQLVAGPGGIPTAIEFHLKAGSTERRPLKRTGGTRPKAGSDATPGAGSAGPTWRGPTLKAPGREATPPPATLAALRLRINTEKSQTPAQRRPAIQLLSRLGTPAAFAALEQIVRNEDENYLVRGYAAEGMGYVQYRPFAAKVRALIETKQMSSVSNAIMGALHFMDDPGREVFYIEQLNKSSLSYLVGAAAKYLAVMDSPTARTVVITAARTRQPMMLRYQAYSGARYLSGGIPLDVVKAAAREKGYALLQANGLRDYLQLDPDGARTMAHSLVGEKIVYTVALALVDVLGPNAGPPEVRSLLLLGIGGEAKVRERVLGVLKPIRGAAAVKELLLGLKATHAGVRTIAATVLAEIPNRHTTDALLKAAKKEPDTDTLGAICEALGRHADPRAVNLLLKIGKNRDPERRNAAIRALAAIGPGNPKVSKFLLKLLTSKRWEDRVFALDAAAANPAPALAKKVIDNLRHKAWQVRLAACQALGKIRVKAAVDPLIDRVEDDKSRGVVAAAAEALFLTTGENFYDIAKIWRQWWTDHQAKFTVPKAVPHRPKGHSAGSASTFYGLPLISDRLCFVIDQSGSMSATDGAADDGRTRFEVAIEEVLGAVGKLRPADWVNVVLFETNIQAWQPQLKQVGPNKPALTKFLKKQAPRGGTNLWDGLEAGLNMQNIDTIYLLSDGAPGAGKFTAPSDILRETKKINQLRRITIHCISIGADSQLLKDLAAQNTGRYVRR